MSKKNLKQARAEIVMQNKRDTQKESQKPSITKVCSLGSNHDIKVLYKNEAKRSNHFGDAKH